MRLPWRQKQERQELVREIRVMLEHVLHRSDDERRAFICQDDIDAIWTTDRLRKLSNGLDWNDIPLVHDKFRKILSILIFIHFEEWEDFKRIFLNHTTINGARDRTDSHLPFNSHSRLFDNHANRDFLQKQYIFIPVVLVKETRHSGNHAIEYGEQYRMPFIKSEFIGDGATGTVFKELVAKNYFQSEGGQNPKEIYVARKIIPRGDMRGANATNFAAEQRALRSFKECLTHNGNIMHSYTSFTHGNDFTIISPLADLDLYKFFAGEYQSYKERQVHFTPLDLLREASCLAGALHFLHYGLRLRDKRIACAHLDFKPENILVMFSDNTQMPVGQWLVHDFGTSRIKEHSEEADALAPGDFLAQFSLTKSRRNPGPYQAPEVQPGKERVVGRESDAWSFGCFLAVVLAFALGGPECVNDLFHSRFASTQSSLTRNDYFYTFDGSPNGKAILKPTLVNWLNSLRTDTTQDKWIERILDLIFKLLVEDPKGRLSAQGAQDELDIICYQEHNFLKRNCSWTKLENQMPLPAASQWDSGLHPVTTPPQQFPGAFPSPNPSRSGHTSASNSFGTNPLPRQSSSSRSPPAARGTSGYLGPPPANERPRTSSIPTIVRVYTDGFENISPEVTSPTSQDRSRSSSAGLGTSLTADVTFAYLLSPPGASRSRICASSQRVGLLSSNLVQIPNVGALVDWGLKQPKRPVRSANGTSVGTHGNGLKAQQGFQWDLMSMCGNYIVLRGRSDSEYKYIRKRCHAVFDRPTIDAWDEDGFSGIVDYGDCQVLTSDAINELGQEVFELDVNGQGEVLFSLEDALLFYSATRGFHELPIEGSLRRARFSTDGNLVFAWSETTNRRTENHWSIWNARTSLIILKKTTPRDNISRPGSGKNNLIFPLATFFLAFEIPNRLYIVRSPASPDKVLRLTAPVEDVLAGASYEDPDTLSQGLILAQKSALINLPFIPNIEASKPSKPQQLQRDFNKKEDAIAVITGEMGESFVIVSHADGLVERRRLQKV